MSFFKSNKTNTTATVNETTEENANKGGGLLTTLAVAGGTAIGIGAVIFGGRKAYKYFHRDEEIINSEDDEDIEESKEDEDFIEVPVVEAPVDDFKEVETEIPVNEAPVEAEEVKTEEPTNEEPVEAEEAEEEKPSKVEETKTMKFERLIGKVVSSIPYDAPETVDLTHHIRCMGGYLYTIDMKDLEHTGRLFISEQCLAMTNLVIGAIIHMISGDINDLEDYHHVYGNIKRLIKEFKESNIMDFTQNPELCKAIFEENTHMVMQNLVLTKDILNLKEVKPAASKTSTGENQTADKVDGKTKSTENCFNEFKDGHKETNKVEGETKTSTKSSDENQKLIDNIDTIMEEIPVLHPERCDMRYLIRCMGGYIHKLNKDSLNKEELDQLRGYCADMTSYANRAIRNISLDKLTDVDDIYGALGDIKMIADEFVASGILEYTYTPNVEKRTFNNRYKAACERLSDAKKKMTASTTKTAKKASNETHADVPEVTTDENQTVEESPSETQIGNSTVVSDDGETVTLKAMVSQESIDNVNDVIDIVSKIPNREHPELNDMGYTIRVIGSRIHKITEPEATFLAYDDTSKSNKFIDACVDICDMTGKAICNLANSGKNPLASMQWIDECTNELVASGIIDNTYDPNTYRVAILKAHKEAMDVLSKLVSGETKTDTNEKVIDKIDTVLNEIGSMAEKHFENVSVDTLVSKMFEVNNALPELDGSNRSKATKRIAENKINITISAFCKLRQEEANSCEDITKVPTLISDVNRMRTLTLSNVEITNITLIAINKAFSTACNKAEELGTNASDETQADDKSSGENQTEDTLTYTMSEKIQEAVQQSDETAATTAPEPDSQAPMSPEASSLASKLQEVGELMRDEKWSEASEFYKTQLTPYLADDGLSKELRDEIMSIKTKATNMMMSQKQLEAKQKAASAKTSKKASKKRRRH